jgi:hypothetical protein
MAILPIRKVMRESLGWEEAVLRRSTGRDPEIVEEC